MADTPRANAAKTFYGRICPRGHDGKRFVVDSKCCECVKEMRQRGRVRRAAYAKARHEDNPELRAIRWAAWREKNLDYDKRRCLIWQKANMPKAIAGIAKRKAAILQRTPKWCDESQIVKFYEEAKRLTDETGIQYEVDHIVPLQGKNVCGLHVPGNLRVITCSENRKKGNRFGEHNAAAQVETASIPDSIMELFRERREEVCS